MFGFKRDVCQSCGMPMGRDPLGGGTNADGTITPEYCSRCYRGGRFTDPDITASEMVLRVRGKLKEMHFPGFLARRMSRDIPTLRRWLWG
jgi:Putative zinc ribbon domain